jgi:glycosyltransferase involved in cell wall biosynthesis
MVKPVGGLGEQFKQIHDRLKDRVDFYVMGFPEEEHEKKPNPKYCDVYDIFPMIGHSALNTIGNQINYFYSSITCPVRPQYIHTLDYTTYVAGVFASRFWKVPLLATMNLSIQELGKLDIRYCNDYDSFDGRAIHDMMEVGEIMGLYCADKIIHVSSNYAKNFPYKEKSVVISNGIDLNFWTKPHNEYKFLGKNKIKIVYIGRFAEAKGMVSLCEANIREDVDLYFVGDERGCESWCYDMVMGKINNKNIFHIDFVYGDEKRDIMRSADAIIMPSLHEPFGIVGLEALASKSILLSSFKDGVNDYLTKDVGIDCGITSQSIEKAINILVEMNQSQTNYRKNKGFEIAKKHDWDLIVEKYYELYTS